MILKEPELRTIFTDGWFEFLKDFLLSEDFNRILKYLDEKEVEGVTIFPEKKNIFKAFRLTPLEDLKVIWLGLDP